MAVKIDIPQKAQDSSMARRLFSMAAPTVGTALGGPVGGAMGSILATKAAGGTTQDALISGISTGVGAALKGKSDKPKAVVDDGLNKSKDFKMPELGESAYGRRLNYLSEDPQVGIQEGLNTLAELPTDHPLRTQYTEPLVKTQFMLQRPKLIR